MTKERTIVGPYAMRQQGAKVELQFENAQYAEVFFRNNAVRAVNALQPAWEAYAEGKVLDDFTLEACARICEESTSWGLSPTKEEVAASTRRAMAKFIRAQKSDSPERLAHEAREREEAEG